MGLLDDAKADLRTHAEAASHTDTDTDDTPTPHAQGAAVAHLQGRGSTVTIAGEEVEIEEPETVQPKSEGGNWLTGAHSKYGIPRGTDAVEQRQIVQTSAMQSIANGIVDQLLGGDLVFQDNEEVMEGLSSAEQRAAGDLKEIIRDVLTGPHMGDEDLDDLVTAAVEDMLGPANGYWQLLRPASDQAALPVVSLTALDPLTIRHNVNKHGFPKDPPYWQAQGAFTGGSVANLGEIDPTALQTEDLAVFRYPRGHRSWQRYPISPAWQVKEWLEILANSTVHHNRFYADNEIPPGLIQVIGASTNTVDEIKDKIENASGDPRTAPVVGGEGGAQWIEMGGTSINLDIISEQQFFFEMCLGALGLGKSEVGLIEDTNRANGEIEAERVYKRVSGPFGNQFEEGFLHICRQFEAYRELGEPFTPKLAHSDPRAEREREQRLRGMFQDGGLTYRQYVRRRGDADLADDPDLFTVQTPAGVVDYGDDPLWLAKRKVDAALGTSQASEEELMEDEDDEGDGEQSAFGVANPTPRHNGGR